MQQIQNLRGDLGGFWYHPTPLKCKVDVQQCDRYVKEKVRKTDDISESHLSQTAEDVGAEMIIREDMIYDTLCTLANSSIRKQPSVDKPGS